MKSLMPLLAIRDLILRPCALDLVSNLMMIGCLIARICFFIIFLVWFPFVCQFVHEVLCFRKIDFSLFVIVNQFISFFQAIITDIDHQLIRLIWGSTVIPHLNSSTICPYLRSSFLGLLTHLTVCLLPISDPLAPFRAWLYPVAWFRIIRVWVQKLLHLKFIKYLKFFIWIIIRLIHTKLNPK